MEKEKKKMKMKVEIVWLDDFETTKQVQKYMNEIIENAYLKDVFPIKNGEAIMIVYGENE